jgi:hypothetical protein
MVGSHRFSGPKLALTPGLLAALMACAAPPPAPAEPQPTGEEPAPPAEQVEVADETAPQVEDTKPEPIRAEAVRLFSNEKLTLDAKADEPFWKRAKIVEWETDWAGKPSGIKTRVRLAYSPERALHLLWELDGAAVLNTQKGVPVDKEHTKLWQDDAAEIFLGSPDFQAERYYEIEVGPLGHYFDLAVNHHLPEGDAKRDDIAWSSGLRKKVLHDPKSKSVVIEMTLESPDIAALMKPGAVLPMGLYRIEGKDIADVPDGRHYLAWSPTMADKPAFHVPEKFGRLVLSE